MPTVVEIVIDENGKVTSTTKGFVGGTCLKTQQAISDGLKEHGIDVEFEGRVLTAEAQACVKAQQKLVNGGGA